jgi:hypothetical protein
MVRRITDILADATKGLDVLFNEAFQAGRACGRQEASKELQTKLAAVFELRDLTGASVPVIPTEPTTAVPKEPIKIEKDVPPPPRRAPLGSVKPAILRALEEHPGLTTAQIEEITGQKPNSVRGTLWTLSARDKVIERRSDGRWYLVAQKNEAADAQSWEDTSAASITDVGNDVSEQPEAQGREAGPGGGT